MKTKLFFSTLAMAATLAVAPAVFAEDEPTNTASYNYEYNIKYQRGNYTSGNGFSGIGITVDGTVTGFTLTGGSGTTPNADTAITNKSVVFIGSGQTDSEGKLIDSVTITTANINNSSHSTTEDDTTDVFAVEGCTVIIDNVTIEDFGMNLTVGTMYEAGDAELIITNGAKVITGAYLDTVGSNLNTGTITITGTDSLLANQQITLGGGVSTLFAGTADDGQYQTKWFVTQDVYENYIRDVLVSSEFDPTSGSYGIVNVTDGGTWEVGVGNRDFWDNRIQLANGEINIDGAGSQLILGDNSSLLVMNESLFSDASTGGVYTGMNISETITVTKGGKISVENGGTLYELTIGENFVADNTKVVVSVDGSDTDGSASSFIIAAKEAVYIGANSGYWTNTGTSVAKYDGGTADVTVSATDKGVIDISSTEGGIVVCADNYASYLGAMTSGEIKEDVGHSYGLKVALTAESGGSLTLNAEGGNTVLLAAGSPSEGEYKNTLTVTADGAGSSVTISGGDIYTNYGEDGTGGADNVYVTITATNGGAITLSAETANGAGTGLISFGKNTAITVDNGSSLTASGTVKFEAGSSLTVSVVAEATNSLAAGDSSANVSLGAVTIDSGASVYVVIDVSSLSAGDQATVAVLQADSITLNTDALSDDNVNSIAAGYFTADENGYTLDSWSWVPGDGGSKGTLYANVTVAPEPSMFSLFFGLAAIGLVATRRRRRA